MIRESGEKMTSRVIVNATLDEMEELFNGEHDFSIRYYERTEKTRIMQNLKWWCIMEMT